MSVSLMLFSRQFFTLVRVYGRGGGCGVDLMEYEEQINRWIGRWVLLGLTWTVNSCSY